MNYQNGSIKTTYREALKLALRDALNNNEKTFLIGEDVGRYGGAFAVSKGFLKEFGPERVMDAPLSESGFVGAGIGAAMGGMRPIVEIMTINFSLLAMDQIVNNAATFHHMSGGQISVPVVIRMSTGIGRQLAGQHSHSWEPLFAAIPGLRILAAGTHEDARGMLSGALNQLDPVIIFEYIALLNNEAELPADLTEVDIHKAKILKPGNDVTIITYGLSVYKALEAAKELSGSGIDAEVLDLRVLRPLDEETILRSVAKTNKVLIVENAWRSVSVSSEISARIMEQAFFELDAPVQRLCGAEVPTPYPKHLEDASVPQKDDIVTAIKNMF